MSPTIAAWVGMLAVLGCAACSDDEGSASKDDDDGTSSSGGSAGAGGGGSGGAGGGGAPPAPDCEPGTKTGDPAGAEGLQTPDGTSFNVRTPPGYDGAVGSPLLVVYAPAGANENQTEQFTGLTADGTAVGMVVVYVDHITPQNQADFDDAATVPGIVSQTWCIDQRRIYLTGHSDGGSIATVIPVIGAFMPAAIAPSAAGANGMFFAGQTCTPPLPVMVLHGSNDQLFPGFGAEAADWWSTCNGCAAAGPPLADGCVVHTPCTGDVEVQYCETNKTHPQWPNLNQSMLQFLLRFESPG